MSEANSSPFNDELEEFVKNVITAIDNSKHRNTILKSNIEFEILVSTKKEIRAGFKIWLANGDGKYEKDAISKIKFSMGYNDKGS